MRAPDSPRYRRTGPIDVVPAPKPRRRRIRKRWIAVFAVVLGVQAGWIGSVALAQAGGPRPTEAVTAAATEQPVTATPIETLTPTHRPTPSAQPTKPIRTSKPRPTEAATSSDGGGSSTSSTGGGASTTTSSQLFAADSPWNTTIGSGATYSPADSALTRSLTSDAGRAIINSTSWSVPIAVAGAGDPTTRVQVASGTTAAHRMPRDADPSNDSDAELAVIDGSHSYEYWGLSGSSGSGWSARFGAIVDLNGSGTTGGVRASGFSLLGGLIRTGEVSVGIDHALVIALAADQLQTGPVAPARSQDGDAASSYSGEVHMGSLVAIPRSVDLDGLHLSPAGLRLARALQRYGAYVGDRSSQLTLYAQPEAEGAGLQAMRTALSTELAPLLRVVSKG